MDRWQAFRAAQLSTLALADAGIIVDVVDDSATVPSLLDEIGKDYITPVLDPRNNDFSTENSFWMTARKGGKLVILGGARVDDVGRSAADFIRNMMNRGYSSDCILHVAREVDLALHGRVAYFGDLKSIAGVGLGRKNVRWFTCVAHYVAACHFRADVVYSFMRGADVLLGSADRNGFDNRLRQPLIWGNKPDGRGEAEQLVYRLRSENDAYFQTIIQELAYSKSGQTLVPPHSQPLTQA